METQRFIEYKSRIVSAVSRAIVGKDIIVGTFFLAGVDEEDLTDLSDDLAEKYDALFKSPQVFVRSPRGILVLGEDGTQELIRC